MIDAEIDPTPGQIVEQRPPQLLTALLAVQSEVKTLNKDETATVQTKSGGSYEYHYLSLDKLIEAINPALVEHRLVWSTLPIGDADSPALAYRLAHADTGEAITGTMPLLVSSSDMQALGSAITYARRYSLCAVLNLAVADEDDDGGGTVSVPQSQPANTVNLQQEAKGLRNEAINNAFAKVGLPAHEKPWGPLGRIPAEKAEALSEALAQMREMR